MDELEVDVINRPSLAQQALLCVMACRAVNANDIYAVALGRPQDICERLIRDAMVRQASDNATAAAVYRQA
jgi:hypothetical protein